MKLKVLLAVETIFIVICFVAAIIQREKVEEQQRNATEQAERMRINTQKAMEEAISQRRIAEEAVAQREHYRQMLKECQEN